MLNRATDRKVAKLLTGSKAVDLSGDKTVVVDLSGDRKVAKMFTWEVTEK